VPGPTLAQRIEELRRELDRLSAIVERQDAVGAVTQRATGEQIGELKDAVLRIQQQITELTKACTELDGRANALEKGSDRIWQFAPMVISGVGVVIALIALFVKK